MTDTLQLLPLSDIRPNPYQPRQHFGYEQLEELAQSIRHNGLIQPIIVRQSPILGYELLAGERRLRASQLAGLTEIPAIVKDLSDEDLLFQSIIENLQRADLNPIEEAKSYEKLITKGLTHDEIAHIMGKSRPYISNLLRLLGLSSSTQASIEKGEISQGHARLLIGLSNQQQEKWVQTIQENGWSVRKLEQALKKKTKKQPKPTDVFLHQVEKDLYKQLGSLVHIQQYKNGGGRLVIDCSTAEELERLIHTLKETGG